MFKRQAHRLKTGSRFNFNDHSNQQMSQNLECGVKEVPENQNLPWGPYEKQFYFYFVIYSPTNEGLALFNDAPKADSKHFWTMKLQSGVL